MIATRSTRWTMICAVAATALGATVAGCGGSSPSPKGDSSVTIRLTSDFANFDIQSQALYPSNVINSATADTLIWQDARTRKFVPYLAESWDATPAKITFTIRSGASCTNGDAVTADVVADSFNRLIKLKPAATAGSLFGKGPFKAKADGDKFIFSTASPDSGMLYGFAQAAAQIICPEGLAALRQKKNALATTTYGSGPYEVKSAQHGRSILLTKRPEWNWGPEGITANDLPDRIVYQIVPNDTTAANQLRTGALDITPITGSDVARMSKDSSLLRRVVVASGALMLATNQRSTHVTSDPAIRHAIGLAVDEKDFIAGPLGGQATYTSTYFSPDEPCYWKEGEALHVNGDVAAAKSYLLDHGYTESGGQLQKNGAPVRLVVLSQTSQVGNAGEYLSSVLSEVGFKVDLQLKEFTAASVQAFSGKWDVFTAQGTRSPLLADAGLPYYRGPAPPNGVNIAATGAGVPEYEAQIDRVNRASLDDRCTEVQKLQEIILKNDLMTPLGAQKTNYFARPAEVADFAVGPLLASPDPRLIRMK